MPKKIKNYLLICLDVVLTAWAIGFFVSILIVRYPYYKPEDYRELPYDRISFQDGLDDHYTPIIHSQKYGNNCDNYIYLSDYLNTVDTKKLKEKVNDIEKNGFTFTGYFGKYCYWERSENPVDEAGLKQLNFRTLKFEIIMGCLLLVWPVGRYIRNNFLTVLCLIGIQSFSTNISAQNVRGIEYPSYYVDTKVDTVYSFKYDSTIRIYRTNIDTNDISLAYPEEVLVAMINADNNEWVKFYAEAKEIERRYKKDRHYETLKASASRRFYFQPILKFAYIYEGEPHTFIRYRIVDERVPFNITALSAIKYQNRKYKLRTSATRSDITFALTYLKKDILLQLLDPNDTRNPELKDQVYTDGTLDLSLLGRFFMQWYKQPDAYAAEIKKYVEKI